MRTLYLNENDNLNIVIDGPSLWIEEDGKGQRIPFRLVNEVIVSGNIKLETKAISVFARRGTPVVFLDKRGTFHTIAIAPGAINRNVFEFLSDKSKIVEAMENLLNAQRKKIQYSVAKDFFKMDIKKIKEIGFHEKDYQRFLKKIILSRINSDSVFSIKGTLRGMMHGLISKKLLDASLNPHNGIISKRENYGLVLDFDRVMEIETDWIALQFIKYKEFENLFKSKSILTKTGHHRLVNLFEKRRNKNKILVDSLLDSLFRLVKDYPL
jgi:hypothetical protein|tara:strand:- start:394 stop:1197 length:804 start_codon:yes stop_codon:yes gene_type:complete